MWRLPDSGTPIRSSTGTLHGARCGREQPEQPTAHAAVRALDGDEHAWSRGEVHADVMRIGRRTCVLLGLVGVLAGTSGCGGDDTSHVSVVVAKKPYSGLV